MTDTLHGRLREGKAKLLFGRVSQIVPPLCEIGQYLACFGREFALDPIQFRTKLRRSYSSDLPRHRNRYTRSSESKYFTQIAQFVLPHRFMDHNVSFVTPRLVIWVI